MKVLLIVCALVQLGICVALYRMSHYVPQTEYTYTFYVNGDPVEVENIAKGLRDFQWNHFTVAKRLKKLSG